MELDTSDLVPSLKYLTENKKNSASKYKPLILTLLTHIETDKNYKLFHSDYMKIQDKYKALHKLLKKFISNYIEKVDNQYKLKKLLIDSEDASINIKRKTDAEEIINYGIFFPMIPTFRTLDKFIIKYEELFKQIDVKYVDIKQNYNDKQGITKKLGIFSTTIINEIETNIKLYFLKFIYLFEKYIDAIKLGKLKIITFDDLNKIIDLLSTFIVLYNDNAEFDDNRYKELFIIISLFYNDNDNNKELFIDKKIFGNSKTNTPSIQIIYDDLKKIYDSTPTKTITLADKLEFANANEDFYKTNMEVKNRETDAARQRADAAVAEVAKVRSEAARITDATRKEANTIKEQAQELAKEAARVSARTIEVANEKIKKAAEATKADAAKQIEAARAREEAATANAARQIEEARSEADNKIKREMDRAFHERQQELENEQERQREHQMQLQLQVTKETEAARSEAERAVAEAKREADRAANKARAIEAERDAARSEAERAAKKARAIEAERDAARSEAERAEAARLRAVAETEAIRKQHKEAQVEREAADAERRQEEAQAARAERANAERRQQEEARLRADAETQQEAERRKEEAIRRAEPEAIRQQQLNEQSNFINYLKYYNFFTITDIYSSIVYIEGIEQAVYSFNIKLNEHIFSSSLLRVNDLYYVRDNSRQIVNVNLRNIRLAPPENKTLTYNTSSIITIDGIVGNLKINYIKINLNTGAQISSGGGPDVLTEMDKLLIELEEFKEPIYEAIILKEIMNISENEPETTENLLLPIQMPRLVKKLGKLNSKLNFFNGIVKKLKEKQIISSKELESFNNIENKIKNLDISPDEEKSRQEILVYIEKTKKQLEQQNINIKDANIIDTTKVLVNFKKVADIIKLILIGLTVICIIIYIVVLLISIYNLINLLLKVIISIIYLFYNTAITNNDTLSYTTKRIIKCTKDNYADDIFNVLNEQLTALSIFNTNLYIIYILLGYVIVYLLYFIYTSIFAKYFLLVGTIKDIDPNFTLLTIIAIIFISSFVHLLIYKFLFKSICLNKFKEINVYEENIDNQFKNILSSFDQDDEYNTKFYNILTDTTKRSEIDTIFQNKVLELQDDTKNNLTQFLLIYDIYIYFEEFIYINDKKREDIKKYFDELNKGNIPPYSFISFLDINERKLIKPYHEDLPFYKQIPIDKIETYKKINDTIGDLLANINKSIIKYSGTFYPFLFTCIYIIIICIYNFVCVYLILSFISGSKNEELFPPFIYTMADKFMDVSRIIYNLFNK